MVYVFIILTIISADLFTKKLIHDKLFVEEKKEIIKDKFYIWHRENKGFSYGKPSQKPNLVKYISGFTCIVGSAMMFLLSSEKRSVLFKLSFSMCLGGALANLIDRIKKGSVTDFIFFKLFKNAPVFNIADIFIVFGCMIFFVRSLKELFK